METRLITSGDAAVLAALHADSFGAAAWNFAQISDSMALPTTQGWLAFDTLAVSDNANDSSPPVFGGRGARPDSQQAQNVARGEVGDNKADLVSPTSLLSSFRIAETLRSPSPPEDGRRGSSERSCLWQDYKPLGFILCQITTDEAEILTFCTSPAARRKGIGRTLLATALDAVYTQNAKRMFLEVAVDNNAAIKLYEQAGFRIIGKRANYYQHNGQSVDAVMLSLDL